MKALETSAEHRSVGLIEETPRDVHYPNGIDPEQIPIVGEVVHGAQ